MLVSEEVEVTLSGRTIGYYENLGYEIPRRIDSRGRLLFIKGSQIIVKVNDLPKTSNQKVQVLCDYCHETIMNKEYYRYINIKNQTIDKDCCFKCLNKKIVESNIINFGVPYASQREDVAEKISGSNSLDYSYVKSVFNNKNCILVSDKYINYHDPLDFICNYHLDYGIQTTTFMTFINGCGCKHCGIEVMASKRRKSFDEVKKIFDYYDLILLSSEEDYKNYQSLLNYICKKHNNIVQQISLGNLLQNKGCKLCGLEKISGENHYRWKGGITTLVNYLRDNLKEWKILSMKQSNYQCCLTEQYINKDFVIHHLYSFNKIFDNIIKKNNIKVKTKISDYTNDELDFIKEKFIKEHDKILGVCINPDLHKFYHKVYGNDNTPEQFEGFKDKYRNFEFDYLLEDKYKYKNILKAVS